jgi:hypothetical protein
MTFVYAAPPHGDDQPRIGERNPPRVPPVRDDSANWDIAPADLPSAGLPNTPQR